MKTAVDERQNFPDSCLQNKWEMILIHKLKTQMHIHILTEYQSEIKRLNIQSYVIQVRATLH